MNFTRILLSLMFVFFASAALAKKPPKTLICHVTHKGKINLIKVRNLTNHIGNEAHSYSTELDYYPPLAVLRKEGKKDTDRDGVDDGCEPPPPCPCLPALSTALGQAYLEHPLAGATVALLNADGSLIYEDTTNLDGFFTLQPETLPADFTVVVTGGTTGNVPFDGELVAIIEKYSGWESVGVNPLTTLIAAHHAEHDGESIEMTQAHVREHLTISPLHRAEGLHLGNTETAFSAAVFVAAAEEHSDFDSYIDHVSDGVHSGELRSYGAGDGQLGAGFDPSQASAGLSIIINAAKVVSITGCLATSGKVTMQSFAGCVMGHGTGTDPAIIEGLAEINTKLKEISDEINNLAQVEMARFVASTQQDWHLTIAGLDDNYFHPSRTVMTKLVCATYSDYRDETRKACRDAAEELAGNLLDNDMSARLANDLAGSQAGRIPDLRAMSNFARVSSGRFFRNANEVSTAGTAADFIQSAWNFIDSNQALLVYVLVEYENAAETPDTEYINRSILYPFLGNPAFSLAVDGTAQLAPPADRTGNCESSNVQLTNCRGFRERELRLVPRALPAGAVVDSATGLMWLQNIGSHAGLSGTYNNSANPDPWDGLARAGLCSQHALSDPASAVWPATSGQDCAMAWTIHTMSPEFRLGYENWRSPTLTELKRLVEPGIDGKPSDETLDEWLSNAGGFYWIIDPGYRTPLPLSALRKRWLVPEAQHQGALEACVNWSTQNCSNLHTRAWTSTSNGVFTPCEGSGWSLRPECTPSGQLHTVDLKTGYAEGASMIWSMDEFPAWSIAVRKLAPCEFYYDDTSGPSPADVHNCQR